MATKNPGVSRAELKLVSEAHLVALAQAGDEAAFRALFECHKRRVYTLCLRMTHVNADAEDLTQEIFLQVFRKIATFRAEALFSTWLHRVAVNEILMHLRKKRILEISLDEPDVVQDEPLKREYAQDDLQLSGVVDRFTLSTALAELSDGYREVLLLHDMEGYRHNEIAQIRNCSIGNSKSQLHKARRKLREWFRLHCGRKPSGKSAGAKEGFALEGRSLVPEMNESVRA